MRVQTPDTSILDRIRSGFGPSASVALRSLVLVAIAMLLILVILPVALGAAGPGVAHAA
jgi:hypothetical protein